MAKDTDTGVDPKAKDGQPDADQVEADNDLKRRRELKEARDRAEEAAVAGKRGRPVDDQPADEPEDEPTMFPLGTIEGDPKTTWRNLIKAGTPVKLECALSRAAVPMTAGLHAFGEQGEVLVTFEAGVVKSVPELGDQQADGKRKLKGVKLVQELRAVHVRSGAGMFTLDQVLDILEQEFGVPRTADKVAKVFGLTEPRAASGR